MPPKKFFSALIWAEISLLSFQFPARGVCFGCSIRRTGWWHCSKLCHYFWVTLADGSMLLSLEIRTEVFFAVLLLLVTSHAFDSSLGLIWMPLAPTVKMPSVNGLFSTFFPACSWPLHGRMKMLIICHHASYSVTRLCCFTGWRKTAFLLLQEVHIQQMGGRKSSSRMFLCCLRILFFCMGLQNKISLGSYGNGWCYKTFLFIFCFMWPHLRREVSWCYSSCLFVVMLWLSHSFKLLCYLPALHILSI